MKHKHFWFGAALIGLVFAPTAAFAQDAEGEGGLESRTYDFADDLVEGELVRPDGELIEGQRHREGSSLISIREHFIDRMIESVEDL
jgi:hypothetical protein